MLPCMTDTALHERPFDAFLSHAHADSAVVGKLHAWLEQAGLKIWFDATHLPAGGLIGTELGSAMAQCRAALVVISKASVESGWVRDEWNQALVERNRKTTRDFRLIPIRIDDCALPEFLEATKFVDMVGRMDELSAWADILDALVGEATDLDARRPLDLYISRSWQSGREQVLPDQVLARLNEPELRLIGDSPDWPTFSGDRIRAIMRSCAGVVCVIPKRPRTADNDKLKYFIREARTAIQLGLPLLVIAETDADLPADLTIALRAGEDGVDAHPDLASELSEALQDFVARCRARPRGGHVFLATDFDDASRQRNQILRRMIQRCSGLTCVVGEQVGGDAVHSTIMGLIRDAVWVLADISGNNLNTCIEAGAACGAGVPCTLVARKPYQQQAFMLRGMELRTYASDIELLAMAHQAARAYRRKVLQAKAPIAP
jgi:hypothetical protein